MESRAKRKGRRGGTARVLWTAGLGLLLAWCARVSEVTPSALFDADGRKSAWDLFGGLLSPDFGAEFVDRVAMLTLESLAIGALGMALALLLGVPLAILAARIPALERSPWERLRGLARAVLALLRSIPEIVWAFLFVRILGLGPGPAVLAIGLTFAGIVGKLYAELMEAVDPEPVRALARTGASRFGQIVVGVWPQVRSQWVGYGLFRFECALRSASILGIVGAGGLGQEIDLSIRYFQYDKQATDLLSVLACVILLELLSHALRRRSAAWSLVLLSATAMWGAGRLAIDGSALFTPFAIEQAGRFVASFASPTVDGDLLRAAAGLMGETLAMAFVATAVAASAAAVLAPWRLMRPLFQVTRALPELVWALLFVVWVGPGPFAGTLAIGAHTLGILGRLYAEAYEESEPDAPRALQALGAGPLAVWLHAVLPQTAPRLLSYGLFRYEVNVRATAMVGFVGAGGVGDAIHTAISLFHTSDLATLLSVLLATVLIVDAAGSVARTRLLI